jgi:hypothetical protein
MPKYLVRASGEIGFNVSPVIKEYIIDADDREQARDIILNIMTIDEGTDVIKILSMREEIKT